VEAIRTNLNIDFLLSLVAPQPAKLVTDPTMLPNPAVAGFVLTVAGFEDYANAIELVWIRIRKTQDGRLVLPGGRVD